MLGTSSANISSLPEEVLVTVMRDHQKYFAVEDADGKLAPHFLAVLNTEVDEEGAAIIRHGNARVLRARFKDARFFWDFDQKMPLVERVESLKDVTFQKELGSYHWKTEAEPGGGATALARGVEGCGRDVRSRRRCSSAVELAKTDLTTELVKEFTELQGDHRRPLCASPGPGRDGCAGDLLSSTRPPRPKTRFRRRWRASCSALPTAFRPSWRCSASGMRPTGSKDPFALRRAANAIVKILAESDLPLTLAAMC